METPADFKEFCASLNAAKVEYVIVGAHSLAHHGAPRFTGDLDVLVNAQPANAVRVYRALCDFGFEDLEGVDDKTFGQPDTIVQLDYPPVRIDIMTDLSGVSWDQVWLGRSQGDFAGLPVYYIGKRELIANKRATGRHKDLGDVEALGSTPDDESDDR